jgi:hypothetical protein
MTNFIQLKIAQFFIAIAKPILRIVINLIPPGHPHIREQLKEFLPLL